MKIGKPFARARNRIAAITILAALTLGGNLLGLLLGAPPGLLPSLPLSIPIILASCWYPRRGTLFALGLAAVYAVTVFLLSPPDPLLPFTILPRAVFLVLVGGVVALLTTRLRESEQQMQDIIEFLPDATFAIDREGKVIAWNRAIEEMTGVKKEAVLNRGNYEHAIPFYGKRQPLLADKILQGEAGDRKILVSETTIPHFRDGNGAHIRFTAAPLLDANGNVAGAIESIRDVSDQVMMETALKNASHQLNTLAGILRTDLANRLAVLYGHLSVGVMKFDDPAVLSFIDDLHDAANGIRRQIEISRAFREIGRLPPAWMPVQETVRKAAVGLSFGSVSLETWTERLEVFADPHLETVFTHLLENALAPGIGASRIVVTYHLRPDGCAIVVEDDGTGIPYPEKEKLFVQREESFGHGLFLAHEILAITGITIRETGIPGEGAKFEILIPPGGYRFSETSQTVEDPQPGSHLVVRELRSPEFALANDVWRDYHGVTADPTRDRIFATFCGERIVSLARCRRHSDGSMEVDGVFTPEPCRGRGYSRMAVAALVVACHNDDLYMYAVESLAGFYAEFGFVSIPERDLPSPIRERYTWAAGNMEGAEIRPMHRRAGL
ncbi:PAS domain S-box protein [Methanoculleus sp. DTU007]|jgi:PAS domain S-box-containing protein|uniref:PAS domain S-box protein n=1 Tax=Methanoculleus sp. DTU007 TaxID=1671626 RepID=UPI00257BF140|nr:PAS domain S-box protein [Methanoculleus sp. DTU007]